MNVPASALQLRSLVRESGELELSLAEIAVPTPGASEVLVQMQASPINPSDIGLLFGAADMTTARTSGTPGMANTTVPSALATSRSIR